MPPTTAGHQRTQRSPISYGHFASEGGDRGCAKPGCTRRWHDHDRRLRSTVWMASQELLGEVLKADPGMRSEMVLATKAGIYPPTPYDCRPETIVQTCEDSLRRLNTDVIDLFYIHRPDMLTPHADVAEGLMRLVEAGKVREIAVSNYTPSMFSALQSCCPAAGRQSGRVLTVRQDPVWDGTLDQCQEYSATLIAWSPLGGCADDTGRQRDSQVVGLPPRWTPSRPQRGSTGAHCTGLHHGLHPGSCRSSAPSGSSASPKPIARSRSKCHGKNTTPSSPRGAVWACPDSPRLRPKPQSI